MNLRAGLMTFREIQIWRIYRGKCQDANSSNYTLPQPFSYGHSYQRQGHGVGQWPASIEEKMELRAEQQNESIAHNLTLFNSQSLAQIPEAGYRIACLHHTLALTGFTYSYSEDSPTSPPLQIPAMLICCQTAGMISPQLSLLKLHLGGAL